MTANAMARDKVSGQQLSCDADIYYSVTELWQYRTEIPDDTDFTDLLISDNNNREISAIAITSNSNWRKTELDNVLKHLMNATNPYQGDNDDNGTFVRGGAVRSSPQTQKKSKLSDKSSAKGYELKMDHEIDQTEKLKKRTMGLLNRITPEKYDKLCQRMLEIIETYADNEERFTIILDLILNKASTDVEFASQYALLCNFLLKQLPEFQDIFEWLSSSDNAESDRIDKLFKKMMVISCQRRFANQREQISAPIPSNLDDEECSELEAKRKKKFLGTMVIIGELYNKKLVATNIVTKGIIKELLPPGNENVSAVDIEALCKLLKTCGKRMDKNEKSHKVLMDFIKTMKKCAKKFSFRYQVLVDEIKEMSQNKWQLRIKKEKAKKLDDIHKDFEKLQLQQQKVQNNASNYHKRENTQQRSPQKRGKAKPQYVRKDSKKNMKPKPKNSGNQKFGLNTNTSNENFTSNRFNQNNESYNSYDAKSSSNRFSNGGNVEPDFYGSPPVQEQPRGSFANRNKPKSSGTSKFGGGGSKSKFGKSKFGSSGGGFGSQFSLNDE